jgi:hypothetical protein
MDALLLFAPLFLAFEAWQLVICERYLGIKQIARDGDPRALGLNEFVALGWTATLFLYACWMLALLLVPYARIHALALAAVTALGYSLRRTASLKWTLVVLTIEGAIRVGLLVSLLAMAWRRMR